VIRINAVSRTGGQVVLTIEYTTGNGNEFLQVDAEHVVERLKKIRELLGRRPTQSEAREVVVALINEIRAGEQPLVEVVPWENFIGVDLEV
jgi:hypothetical protein